MAYVADGNDFEEAVENREHELYIITTVPPDLGRVEWVTVLTLRACVELQAVPTLQWLRELYVSDCPALTTICPQPALCALELERCPALVHLPGESPLERFVAHQCESIGCTPAARDVELTACARLQLGPHACTRSIVARDCRALARLPPGPRLVRAEFYGCPGLERVAPQPVLAHLLLDGCGGVRFLPEDMPALTTLLLTSYEGEKTALAYIPRYPQLVRLAVTGHPSLSRIRSQPRLVSLLLRRCPAPLPPALPCLTDLILDAAGESLEKRVYPALVRLKLSHCSAGLQVHPKLREVSVTGAQQWVAGLEQQPQLAALTLLDCAGFAAVPTCPRVVCMEVRECHDVVDVGEQPGLVFLKLAWCGGVSRLERRYERLAQLHVEMCPLFSAVEVQPRLRYVWWWGNARLPWNRVKGMFGYNRIGIDYLPPSDW